MLGEMLKPNYNIYQVFFGEQGHIPVVIEFAFPRRPVSRIAIVVEVLGVGQGDVFADQREGLVEHFFHPRQLAFVEDIGRVHRDLQVRRANLVQQTSRLLGRVHHVVDLGFKSQHHASLPGDLGGLAHAGGHVLPCRRRIVVRVASPHVVAVTGTSAEMNL